MSPENDPDDDYYDYPPTEHPGRELFTGCLFVLLAIALAVWAGWSLISFIHQRPCTPSTINHACQ